MSLRTCTVAGRHERILELLQSGPLSTGELIETLKVERLFKHNAKDYEGKIRLSLEVMVYSGKIIRNTDDKWQLAQLERPVERPDWVELLIVLPRNARTAIAQIKEGNVVLKIEYTSVDSIN